MDCLTSSMTWQDRRSQLILSLKQEGSMVPSGIFCKSESPTLSCLCLHLLYFILYESFPTARLSKLLYWLVNLMCFSTILLFILRMPSSLFLHHRLTCKFDVFFNYTVVYSRHAKFLILTSIRMSGGARNLYLGNINLDNWLFMCIY